ncbi:MAG: esterase [Pseudopedobacter saltans]|uniref:Esterase n=1 Tax=Pseudopedobacter saltans TaxID=151895 RepID=A0A2W5ENC5_9SPHI|nr:MAG: esterase [Pseudopedobacter saltans]
MRLYKKNWEKEKIQLTSRNLDRIVDVDFYFPNKIPFGTKVEMLLFNDGQILEEMNFLSILSDFYKKNRTTLLIVIGIHANAKRLLEYGTSDIPNVKGEGALAKNHMQFIMNELIPFCFKRYPFVDNIQANIAGFSLGGLSAFDIAWEKGRFFNKVGVFSGSFWWRSRELLSPYYNNDTDRIMLNKINQTNTNLYPHEFFFECGTMDETSDRNQNGIIDSIDDTQDIIKALTDKGYANDTIQYYEIENGKHDVPTWKDAMPIFLEWGWGK